jgi:phosphatidylserine/phosphatidylglycerophosphate/cardiolipin synthase-like enzyme
MIPFQDAQATHIADRDYYDLMLSSIESATTRVWISAFIFDVRPPRDVEGQVAQIVQALADRYALGVDVRVLTSSHMRTPDIDVANLATGTLLQALRVPHRRITHARPPEPTGSHAKFSVFDDHAIVGSQNLTDDAFRENIEDAVLLQGPPVDALAGEFQHLWNNSQRLANP